MRPTATSRLLAVIGDPVAHSVSPNLFNAAFRALSLDAVYVALRVEASALDTVTGALRALGVAGNVTIPHKLRFAECVDARTERVERLEAVNTYWTEAGRLVGDNTDVDGVLAATDGMQGDWVVVGTGGAARAVAAAAHERGIALRVRSRDPARADAFSEWATAAGYHDVAPENGDEVGVVWINATPLGLQPGDPMPLNDSDFERASAVMDMTYARRGTALVGSAKRRNLPAVDGRIMLVAQAAASFERFFPGVRAPFEIMRAGASRALA